MSSSTIDWAKLYSQGRVRNFGVPWSEEEAQAVSLLKIPADYVRRGCLTVEAYEAMQSKDAGKQKATGKIYLPQLTRARLVVLCEQYGIPVTDDATKSAMLEELALAGCPKAVEVLPSDSGELTK